MVLRSLVLLASADGVTFTRHVQKHTQRHTDSRRSLSAVVITERAWAPCIRRLVVQQVEILRNSEQPLLRLDFNECVCVCGWLPAALNLGGRVICVLISTEQREKEGKLFLFLFLRVCNKAPCSKSFNLSRNEGYISVFWLLRTISPSLSLSAFHSHTYFHQTTAETEPALLMESRRSCLSSLSHPFFLFMYM